MVKMERLSVKTVEIIGVIPSYAFQRAKYLAIQLNCCMPLRFPVPKIIGLLELEWNDKLMEWRRLYGPEFFRLKRAVAVFLNGKFIGSDTDLLKIISLGNVLMECIPLKNSVLMKRKFRDEYLTYLKRTKLIYCYFDICVDDNFIGTLVFRLYSNILPKTCENFTTLCLGSKGSFLSYKGSRIHRIVKNGWLQGGDIQYKTGGGGFSINCSPLEDECFGISHDRKGVLSMANDGKHTNGSQFFITLSPTTWMDTYYVAFGQVIEGVKVLDLLENIETFREYPVKKIEIKNCGKLDLQDVDDVDKKYTQDMEDAMPKKRPKKIETLADQVMRLVMEAVTEKLALKEHIPDIVHAGDVPSTINLDFFFQGLYSLPEDVLADTAKFLRNSRRELFRHLKPSATEVVEVITYDLLKGVFVKLVDLDDVREATGHPLYEKLIEKIDMNLEMAKKPFVKAFVDQLVTTAENMVKFISVKLNWLRRSTLKNQVFQEQLNEWVQSFTLQETFVEDEYHIVDRALDTALKEKNLFNEGVETSQQREMGKLSKGDPPCGVKKIEKKKIGKPPRPVDICCDRKVDNDNDKELKISDFFSSCIYDMKMKQNKQERQSILDLIERSRYKLRILRNQEQRQRSKARFCLEKRIKRWMKDVVYVSETAWIRQTVFSKNDVCINHTEEMMYGAMTIGLLEMYYLMDRHVKRPKKKVYRTRILYPEGDEEEDEKESRKGEKGTVMEQLTDSNVPSEKEPGAETAKERAQEGTTAVKERKPCMCGDICCDCEYDPRDMENLIPPTPPPSLDASDSLCVGEDDESEPEGRSFPGETESETGSCHPSEIDVEEILAQVMGESAEKIEIKSFRWLRDYIMAKGCQFKFDFASQVHNWLENGVFSYRGFLSKHSLVTKASLLSFSLSLASILKEENDLKSELKDFVYDLWELYFNEMFKEASLEYPIQSETVEYMPVDEDNDEISETVQICDDDEPCNKAKLLVKDDFDFDKFCIENASPKALKSDETQDQQEQSSEQISIMEPVKSPVIDVVKPVVPPEVVLTGEDYGQPEEVVVSATTRIKDEQIERPATKKKSPIIIRELVVSSEEIRGTSPYVLPFWVKFLTEITKRTLGLIARLSRLPRRLYLTSDSQISFDDKMKAWVEFNKFSSPTTGGKDIRDFIADHHVSIENLDETARSFLRKKVITEIIDKSSRSRSAEILAEELLLDLLSSALEQIEGREETKISEELWEDLVSLATVNASQEGENEMENAEATEEETEGSQMPHTD